jgi:hypothetical protein
MEYTIMSQEFKDHADAGEQYTCDKCNDTILCAEEYDSYIKFQYHYCEPCWNYMRLKKGTCTCGSSMTNRSETLETSVLCGCGKEVVLK